VAQFKRKAGGYAFLGSFPAILGGPQSHTCKFHSGILEQCYWMRNTQESKKLDEGLRCRRRSSSLMALMAHQTSLILLFLLPHPMEFGDPSCVLEGRGLGPPSIQIWDRFIHWKERNKHKSNFQETPGRNFNQTTLPLPKVNRRNYLSLLYPNSYQF